MNLSPESGWTVTAAGDGLSVTDPKGEARALARADILAVMIETNDSGPAGLDFWWLVFGADRKVALAFPQGATGEDEAIDFFFALPGFDHEAMIRASASVEPAYFEVWRATGAD